MNIATLLSSVSPSSESLNLRVVLGGPPTTQIHKEGNDSQTPDKYTFGSRNFLGLPGPWAPRILGSSLTESFIMSCWSGLLATPSSRSGEDFCPLRTTHGARLELFQVIHLGGGWESHPPGRPSNIMMREGSGFRVTQVGLEFLPTPSDSACDLGTVSSPV